LPFILTKNYLKAKKKSYFKIRFKIKILFSSDCVSRKELGFLKQSNHKFYLLCDMLERLLTRQQWTFHSFKNSRKIKKNTDETNWNKLLFSFRKVMPIVWTKQSKEKWGFQSLNTFKIRFSSINLRMKTGKI